MPSLPNWAENDPLEHPLVAPPEAKNWKQDDIPIEWGRPVEYPSGRSQVKRALLRFKLESDADLAISQGIYREFPHWLNLFKKYIQLFTTQYTMGDDTNLISGQHSNLSLYQSSDTKFKRISNQQPLEITINLTEKDTSLHLNHLQEASHYASLKLEPRLEYALLLEAYSAKALGDHRNAAVEAASALEVCLTSRIRTEFNSLNIGFGDQLLNKYRALGGRLELAKILNILSPDEMQKPKIVTLRNDVVHKGHTPQEVMTEKAIEEVASLLRQLSPTVYEMPPTQSASE